MQHMHFVQVAQGRISQTLGQMWQSLWGAAGTKPHGKPRYLHVINGEKTMIF